MSNFPVQKKQELNGARVVDLRDLRGLTQAEVAGQISVTQGFLSKVEKGEKPLPESMASELSEAFGVPPSFFRIVDTRNLGTNFTFWKKSTASVKDEKRVSVLFRESSRVFDSLSRLYEQPAFPERFQKVLQDLDAQHLRDDPESVAAALRDFLGLAPGEALRSVTKLTEKLGVGVVHVLDDREGKSDHIGISQPHTRNTHPIIASVAPSNGEELRFALGHELGHLIFDDETHQIRHRRDPREEAVQAFSSALFISNSEMRSRINERLPLHGFVPIKADFGISVKAIIVRANRLGLISKDRYRSLMIQYSSRHWGKGEPVEVGMERAFYYQQLIERTYPRYPVAQASEEMGVEAASLARWIDASEELAAATVPDNVIQLFPAKT